MKRQTKKYSSAVITGLQIAGGFLAAKMINRFIPATVNPNMISGGKVAAGVLLVVSQKPGLGADLGTGMIVAGATEVASKAITQVQASLDSGGGGLGRLPMRMRDMAIQNNIAGMPEHELVD